MSPNKSSSGKKRKSTTSTMGSASPSAAKRPKTGSNTETTSLNIVDRRYYPAEMSNARCREYSENNLQRPIEKLEQTLNETRSERDEKTVGDAVAHWFKCDLRMHDNRALHAASLKAQDKGASLIGLYIISPQDFEAHLRSPARVDFILRSLEILRKNLAELDIPLYVETVEDRKLVSGRILELCTELKATHLYANAEYEVDELRREAKLISKGLEHGIAVDIVHDTCVVKPGELHSGSGSQYAVYSPFYRAWLSYLQKNPDQLEVLDPPAKNPKQARCAYKNLFDSLIPDAPANKQLSTDEKKRFGSMWPAGEHEAKRRLEKFLNEKIGNYSANRNYPASNATSVMSPHLAAGTISARSAVVAARNVNSTRTLDSGNGGITGWISEIAWRDFYRHVLVHWPFICMNKCFKPEYTNIEWEYNDEHLKAWKEGRTGFPFVDAAMRQLNHTGWMHNRCRMVVASFLSKDLLLDWRLGEQYFMSMLIDGDFASNHGGWGFGSSTGVDPQPYFRIFNPYLQSERFDASGDYIRKWVPELAELDNKTIHAPWDRGGAGVAQEKGYPKPLVDHAKARDLCLQRYKKGLGRDTA